MLCKAATLPRSIDLKLPSVGEDANIKNEFLYKYPLPFYVKRNITKVYLTSHIWGKDENDAFPNELC